MTEDSGAHRVAKRTNTIVEVKVHTIAPQILQRVD
jgi:hypothetical protein